MGRSWRGHAVWLSFRRGSLDGSDGVQSAAEVAQGCVNRVYVGAYDGSEAAEEFLSFLALGFVRYAGYGLAEVVVPVSDVRAG